MGRSTKRRQNQCNSCHYTWSPRGHSVSLQCPNCGSRNVGFVPFSFAGLIVSMILAVFLCGGGCFLLSVFFGMSKDNSSDPLTGIQNPNTPGIASSTTSVVAQTDPQPTIDNPDPDPPTTPPPDKDRREREEEKPRLWASPRKVDSNAIEADMARRDREEAQRKLAAQAKAKVDADEKSATAALAFAKELRRADKIDKAIERLQNLIAEYPDTEAAKEARQMLKKLTK